MHDEECRNVLGLDALHEHAVRDPQPLFYVTNFKPPSAAINWGNCNSDACRPRYIGCADGLVVPLR